jgi:hypothetical protein
VSDSRKYTAENMVDGKDEEGKGKHLWRPIDPKIWAPGPPAGRLGRIADRVKSSIAPTFFATAVMLGPLSVLISLAIIYPLVPSQLFGPTILGFWAIVVVAFVVVVEKTGYARNFEGWNLPLKRIVVLPIAFLLVMSLIAILYVLSHHLFI